MQRSSSLPVAGALPPAEGSRLVEGTLYVGREQRGPLEWLPMRFAHNSDGSLSFWSSAIGEAFLDADWTQPFAVAPWKPVTSEGRLLHPFSLSYAPLPGRPSHKADGCRGRCAFHPVL
ncbi:unnamed protein product [Effrenium voratum]|nr:unnamed protein product [Effrenium voratum]